MPAHRDASKHATHGWGPCNTHPRDKKCPAGSPRGTLPAQARAAGIDTVKLVWKPRKGEPIEPLRPYVTHGAGSSWIVRDEHGPKVARIGAYPHAGLLFAECRLAALVDGHLESSRLARPDEIPRGVEHVVRAFELLGVELDPEQAMVQRIDSTAELYFPDPRNGIALMNAAGAADLPRLKVDTWRKGAQTETVYARAPISGKVLMRLYDKGVETREHPAGEVIRLEKQFRARSDTRMLVPEWTVDRIRASYLGAFERLTVSPDLVVGTPWALLDTLVRKIDEQEISATKAERLLGTIVLVANFGWSWPEWSPKKIQRRRRELRDLGIVVTLDPAPVSVPLGLYLDEFRAAWDLALAA